MIFRHFALPRATWPEILLGGALVVILYGYFFYPVADWQNTAPAAIGNTEYAAMPPRPSGTVMAVFIDGLPFDSAVDPRVMPTLSGLRSRGVWGKMIPCAARMTVQCVQTFFNGIDMSLTPPWMLRIPPDPAVENYFWPNAIHSRGGVFRVASGYNVMKLYGDAVAEYYRYMGKEFTFDDTLPPRLTNLALGFYRNLNGVKADAVMIHLLNIDYAGHTYLPGSPEHAITSRLVDRELKRIYDALGPQDTLLVFGDHGMNPIGTHNYARESPTVYVAVGPDFRQGVRYDMDLASLYFFLNVPLRFPFPSWYAGSQPWHTVLARDGSAVGPVAQPRQPAADDNAAARTFLFGLFMAFSVMLLLAAMLEHHPLRHRNMIYGVTGAIVLIALIASFQGSAVIAAALLCIGALVYGVNGKYIRWHSLSLSGAVVVTAIILGLLYQSFDLAMHTVSGYVWRLINLGEFLVGVAVGLWYMRKINWYSPGMLVRAGAVSFGLMTLIFHYPSVYQDGFIRHVPRVLEVLWIVLWPWFGGRYPQRSPRGFSLRKAAWFLLGLLGLLFIESQVAVVVENFVIRWYEHFSRDNVEPVVYVLSAVTYAAAVMTLVFRLGWNGWRGLVFAVAAGMMLPVAWGSVALPGALYLLCLLGGWALLCAGCLAPRSRGYLQALAFVLLLPPVSAVVEHKPGPLFQLFGLWAIFGIMMHAFRDTARESVILRSLFTAFAIALFPAILFGLRAVSIDFDPVAGWGPKVLWTPMLFASWASVVAVAGMFRYPGDRAAGPGLSAVTGWLMLRVLVVSLMAFASWHVSDGHRLGIDALEEAMYLAMFAGFTLAGMGINRGRSGVAEEKGLTDGA